MVTLGLICLFLSFILLIMGLLAWGASAKEAPLDNKPVEQQANEKPRE